MKKYKLIKEYPGSPKLGEEVEEYNNGYRYIISDLFDYYYLSRFIEKYPEFWQEIKEKDY